MEIKIHKRQTKSQGTAFDLYYRWQGQRYRPLLGYDLTKEEAERRALEMVAKIQNSEQRAAERDAAPLTLHDVLPLYWESFQVKKRLDRIRPEGILENHLLSCKACKEHGTTCVHRFGHRTLLSLKGEDGLRYVKERTAEGATAGTIRREWQVLMRILNVAVRYEKLERNPFKQVDLPDADKRTRIAEPEELAQIQSSTQTEKTNRVCREELWRIVLVALNVGLREGKILAIERSWIKKRQDGYWLCLPPAASRIKGNPAEIPLNRIALAALHEALPSVSEPRIFRHWRHARAFKKYWETTCRRLGIHDLHFHDLRHTFTTRLQRLGVDYEVRQALIGHRMPGMTAHYSHGGPEWDRRLREAVMLLDKAYPLSYGLTYEPESEAAGGAK